MKFIAHRGYSKKYPENTLEAFKAVLDHPLCGTAITGIELDVHLTADNKIPVLHETTIPNGTAKPRSVGECSMDELRHHHHKAIGSEIPELESVFSLIDHKITLYIEIKSGTYNLNRFAEVFTTALTQYGPENDVVLSSFSFDILEYMRRHLSTFNLRYAYIFQSTDALRSVPAGVRERFDQLHPSHTLLFSSPELFLESKTPICCWTVNDVSVVQAIINRAAVMPLEAVMTDDLDLATPHFA